MQTKKMSLANVQGKMSRSEMKGIMAGSSSAGCDLYNCGGCPSNCKCETGVKYPVICVKK
jgi:hypothetical protein